MKKLFTFALGGLLTIGAVAYALPAVSSDAPVLYAEGETPALTPSSIEDLSVKWSPAKGGFTISFTAPTQGYDSSSYPYQYYDLTSIDKIVIYTGEYYASEEIYTFENPTPGEALSLDYTNVETGKSYCFKAEVWLGETHDWPSSSDPFTAGTYPETINYDDITITTNQGQVPVTFSFNAPKYYANTEEEISGTIETIELYSRAWDSEQNGYVNTIMASEENVVPGSPVEFVVTEIEGTGNIYWSLRSKCGDGYSSETSVGFFLGEDRPGIVRNLAATANADGSVTLTWDAPDKGSYGGYFNPENLTYRVAYRTESSSSETDCITGLNETTYTYMPATAGKYTFMVYGVTTAGQGSYASATAVAGPHLSIPFTESFSQSDAYGYNYYANTPWSFSTTSAESYPNEFRASNYCYINGGYANPFGGTDAMGQMPYYSSTAAETSAITSYTIDIAEGVEKLNYEFYYYALPGKDYSLELQFQFNDSEFTTAKRIEMVNETEWAWVKAEGQVEVPAGTTTAHVRFQFANGAGSTESISLLIDEIKITDAAAEVQIYPAAAENLTATYDIDADAITIEFDAPSKTHARLGDLHDADLPYISKIEIYRQFAHNDYVLVNTIENPEVGSHQTWVDSNLEGTGNYYYKVLCYFNENCDYGQFLDNPVVVGQIPVDVTDLHFETNRGEAPVTIIFTLPSKDTAGLDLREIRSVKIERMGSPNWTWGTLATVTEDLVPGAEFRYEDGAVESEKSYYYRVTVEGSAGSNYGTQGSIFVGVDNPGKADNVVAIANPDGSITVTWDPVTTSQNGGWFDAENLTYTVVWSTGSSAFDDNAVTVAEGLTDCTATTTVDIEEESAITFFVIAFTGELSGYSASSNQLIVGNPSALPYVETFGKQESYTTTSDHIWASSSDQSYSAWTISSSAYTSTSVYPQADGGLAYAYYNSYNTIDRNDYLTSGKISVSGNQALVAKIDIYQIPGYNTKLALETAYDNGEFAAEYTFEYTDFTTEGWATYYIPFEVPAGAEVLNIRLHAMKIGASNISVIVDGIDLFELPKPVVTTSENSFSWEVAANGYLDVTGWNFYYNEDPATVLDAASYSFTATDESANGTYAVQALYHENTIAGPVSDDVVIAYTGINGINAAAISVKAINGNIVVTCADADNVTISAVNGQVLYNGLGAAKVAVVPGVYMVQVANAPAVKLNVR
ncbi:MAG: hypothetical protein ACI4AM_06835 [Muribaculaceae bacterium]